jgi:hypothetical protein
MVLIARRSIVLRGWPIPRRVGWPEATDGAEARGG